MTEKQDRQGARTAAQLEQEYRFGESFAQAMGLANSAATAANQANEKASNPAKNLTPQEVFDLLTDNGKYQGIFKDDDGNIHISATNVSPGILMSANKKIQIDLTDATEGVPVFNTGISTNGLYVRGDSYDAKKVLTVTVNNEGNFQLPEVVFWDKDEEPLMTLTEDEDRTGGILKISAIDENVIGEISVQATRNKVGITFSILGRSIGFVGLNEKDQSVVEADKVNAQEVECMMLGGKIVNWEQDEGGISYTLRGYDPKDGGGG